MFPQVKFLVFLVVTWSLRPHQPTHIIIHNRTTTTTTTLLTSQINSKESTHIHKLMLLRLTHLMVLLVLDLFFLFYFYYFLFSLYIFSSGPHMLIFYSPNKYQFQSVFNVYFFFFFSSTFGFFFWLVKLMTSGISIVEFFSVECWLLQLKRIFKRILVFNGFFFFFLLMIKGLV